MLISAEALGLHRMPPQRLQVLSIAVPRPARFLGGVSVVVVPVGSGAHFAYTPSNVFQIRKLSARQLVVRVEDVALGSEFAEFVNFVAFECRE